MAIGLIIRGAMKAAAKARKGKKAIKANKKRLKKVPKRTQTARQPDKRLQGHLTRAAAKKATKANTRPLGKEEVKALETGKRRFKPAANAPVHLKVVKKTGKNLRRRATDPKISSAKKVKRKVKKWARGAETPKQRADRKVGKMFVSKSTRRKKQAVKAGLFATGVGIGAASARKHSKKKTVKTKPVVVDKLKHYKAPKRKKK